MVVSVKTNEALVRNIFEKRCQLPKIFKNSKKKIQKKIIINNIRYIIVNVQISISFENTLKGVAITN